MTDARDVWAVVPAKGIIGAKQRLSPLLSAEQRGGLALAMLEDVLAALAATPQLAGIAVVTLDPHVEALAGRYGARVIAEGARGGHTGAVAGATRVLAAERRGAILTMPGDIPLVTPEEVAQVVAAHDAARDFVIAPAHDERGSNAILCAPPDVMPLRFGDDSYLPHLDSAARHGLAPKIVRVPGIGLDIDHPQDLAMFLRQPSPTRAWRFCAEAGIAAP